MLYKSIQNQIPVRYVFSPPPLPPKNATTTNTNKQTNKQKERKTGRDNTAPNKIKAPTIGKVTNDSSHVLWSRVNCMLVGQAHVCPLGLSKQK